MLTFQPFIKWAKCNKHRVMSKTSEGILLANVGSQPLLITIRLDVRMNSRRVFAFSLQSELPHAV